MEVSKDHKKSSLLIVLNIGNVSPDEIPIIVLDGLASSNNVEASNDALVMGASLPILDDTLH